MRRVARFLSSATLLLALAALLPTACSDAQTGIPDCCVRAAGLLEQMDDCCAQNLVKRVQDMSGCCLEGMQPDSKDRPECCSKALALHAQMAECCRRGMKSASDACCEQPGVPSA